MTEFPDAEKEQYIDFLLDRVEWLEQELEESEKEKLALKQQLEKGRVADLKVDRDAPPEEQLIQFMEGFTERINEVSTVEDLGLVLLKGKVELLRLEDQVREERGGLSDLHKRRSRHTHSLIDDTLQRVIREDEMPP